MIVVREQPWNEADLEFLPSLHRILARVDMPDYFRRDAELWISKHANQERAKPHGVQHVHVERPRDNA